MATPGLQYADLDQQARTAELGMWVFLATEVLFFGVLFCVYLTYRSAFPDAFAEAAKESSIAIGAINTAILLTSSLTMVLAIAAAEARDRRATTRLLLLTAGLGAAFMILKGAEYWLDWRDGAVPALAFHLGPEGHTAKEIFWLFYFYATGFHAVHLAIGIAIVLLFAWRSRRGDFATGYVAPLEVVGLYWSFVDVVWCLLFAVIYPVGRGS